MRAKSSTFSNTQPRHSFSIMDEGEGYLKGKIKFLNQQDLGALAMQKEALFGGKREMYAVVVEENYYWNLNRTFSNSLNYKKKVPDLNIVT